MKVTDVKIYPFETGAMHSKIKAYADVTLNNCLVIKGVKIIQGKQGMFIGFPSRKGRDGNYRDMIVSKNVEFHNNFCEAILNAFKNYV